MIKISSFFLFHFFLEAHLQNMSRVVDGGINGIQWMHKVVVTMDEFEKSNKI